MAKVASNSSITVPIPAEFLLKDERRRSCRDALSPLLSEEAFFFLEVVFSPEYPHVWP